MSLRRKIAVLVFAAGVVLSSGPADAASRGTWSPAEDWDGMSPGSFSTMCGILGGTVTFDGGTWTCQRGSTVIVCEQSKAVTSKNCRRYTRFTRPTASPVYQTSPTATYS